MSEFLEDLLRGGLYVSIALVLFLLCYVTYPYSGMLILFLICVGLVAMIGSLGRPDDGDSHGA